MPRHSVSNEERDERIVLAAEIERASAAVIANWLDRVRTDAAAAQVSVTELRGGVENYLTRLAELLRSAETVADVGASAWGDVAREHAITRARLGFDVTQLFHELVVFRRVLTEQLARTGRVVGPTGVAGHFSTVHQSALGSVGSRPRSLHRQSSHPGAGRDDSRTVLGVGVRFLVYVASAPSLGNRSRHFQFELRR
jgi:RsbRD-like negative regulator of sigma factor